MHKTNIIHLNNVSIRIYSYYSYFLEENIFPAETLHTVHEYLPHYVLRNEAKKLFWKAVFTLSRSLYETCLQQINTINEAASHYLHDIPDKK